VGDEADVDAVAPWAHAAAHSGLRVQSAGLLLVDTSFVYPGHGCCAGLLPDRVRCQRRQHRRRQRLHRGAAAAVLFPVSPGG
jgi:hypothetical protein